MASYILDKAYKITDASGVAAHLIVVQGTNAGECKAPAAANAGAILGITTHGQSLQNQSVSVRKAGIARVTAASAIAVGDPVCVAGVSGKAKAITVDASGKANCLGFAESAASSDGDIIEVFISLHERVVATS